MKQHIEAFFHRLRPYTLTRASNGQLGSTCLFAFFMKTDKDSSRLFAFRTIRAGNSGETDPDIGTRYAYRILGHLNGTLLTYRAVGLDRFFLHTKHVLFHTRSIRDETAKKDLGSAVQRNESISEQSACQ